jgi:serine/threonine protein kinase
MTDYQIQSKVHESDNSLVYRAILTQNQQPIILKVLNQDYPTPAQLTRYKQEYEITRSLDLEGVIKTYDLQRYQNSLAILIEDFGGQSLKYWMQKRPFTLQEFLTLAIKIAESLGAIHAANIIHKDINPSNIVYNPETEQLKIIDFGIATHLSHENATVRNPHHIEGTLAYISPEQTGRMNRTIDYRTDFYSLGVTFYELLTHQLPFATTDAMELVHCHIAKQPISPHQLVGAHRRAPLPQLGSSMTHLDPPQPPLKRGENSIKVPAKSKAQHPLASPLTKGGGGGILKGDLGGSAGLNTEPQAIPQAVSNIVMKLMAKTAEERYQSAWGLKADLETCLHQLQTNGEIVEFPLAGQDISDKFQIPQKLYGREREVETLLAAFERVAGEMHPPQPPLIKGGRRIESPLNQEGQTIESSLTKKEQTIEPPLTKGGRGG